MVVQSEQPKRGATRRELPDFFNRACAPFGRVPSANCAPDFACGEGDTADEDDFQVVALSSNDDDSSIVMAEPTASQPPPQQRVMNLVEGILTPFRNCVQPPLYACTSQVAEWRSEPQWRPPRRSNSSSRTRAAAVAASTISETQNSSSSAIFSGCTLSSPSTASGGPTTCTTPRDNDILCGRGNNSNRHIGNQQFRDLIAANKAIYSTLTKKEKMLLARQIVDLILHHTDPPARFLGRDTTTGLWYDIGIPRSLEKTSQALREKTAAVRAAEKQQAAATVAAADSFSVASDAGSDVFSNITDTEGNEMSVATPGMSHHADASMETAQVNNVKSKPPQRNGPVVPPPVKIPGKLHRVFGHHHQQPPQQQHPLPPPAPPQHVLPPTRQKSYPSNPAAPPPHHYYHGPPPPPPPTARQSRLPARHRSLPAQPQPSYDYGPYDEQPYDERRMHPQQHQHHQYADPRRYAPPPPPPPPPQYVHSRSMPATPPTTRMRTPPDQPQPHPNQPQYHYRTAANIVTPQHLQSSRSRSLDYGEQQRQMRQHQQQQNEYGSPRRSARGIALTITPDRHGGVVGAAPPPPSTPEHPSESSLFQKQIAPPSRKSSSSTHGLSHERPPLGSLPKTGEGGGGKNASPTLEQDWKRQRTSSAARRLLDLSSSSNESAALRELNSSGERSGSSGLNTSGASSTGLSRAIETQLTLNEQSSAVPASPSLVNQSYYSSRRRRIPEPLPRPNKMSNGLDVSADSMDGMAALATAAFLRLDETDD